MKDQLPKSNFARLWIAYLAPRPRSGARWTCGSLLGWLFPIWIVVGAQAQTFYWNRNDVLTSSTDANKAHNWTSNADGTGTRPVSGTDDDFTADALGGSWTYRDVDLDVATGSVSLTTNADQITLRAKGNEVFGNQNEYTAVYRSDITGDFDISVKIIDNFGAWNKGGIMVADDFTTLGSGGFLTLHWRTSVNAVQFVTDVSGNVGELETTEASASVNLPVWVRLVKSGTTFKAYYRSAVANAWTQVGQAAGRSPQSTAANSQVGLFMTSTNSGAETGMWFDDFQGGTNISGTGNTLSFNGTGANADANATLSANLAVAALDFTGYTGTFNFGSSTLTVNTGNATFVAGQTVTAGSGTLAFSAGSGTQTFTPKSGATHPNITHTGAGTLALASSDLTALSFNQSAGILNFNGFNITTSGSGNFTVTNGTTTSFSNLGGRTITVGGNASLSGQSGNLLNLNPGSAWTLTGTASSTVSASYANIANGTVNPGTITGSTTNSTDGGGNTRWSFTAAGGTWDGGGGDYNWSTAANWSNNTVPISSTSVTFDGTSTKKCILDVDVAVASIQFTSAYSSSDANTGKFDFGTKTLTVNTGDVNFTMGSGASVVAGTGTLAFTGTTGTQTFTPRSGATYPTLTKSGAGTVAVAANALTAGAMTVSAGTWNWGSSALTHSVTSLTTSGTPTMVFGTNTVRVSSGNANLAAGTFTAGDGNLEFTGTSGTQVLTPSSGQTLPRILKSAASTLQLATNNLTATGFALSAGVLDLNGRNITTVAGSNFRGDFQVWNGTGSTFTNLGGRTITVAGHASFVGASASSSLNMDPGSGWTLAVTGQLNARYANIANSNASVAAGTAYRSGAGAGNTNWTVNGAAFYWDRNEVINTSTDFSKAYNWAYNANGTGIRPISGTDDWFDGISLGGAWTFRDQDNNGSTGSYSVSGGQTLITATGGDIWGAVNEYATVYRTDITGDFDVQVKIVSVTSAGAGNKVGLIMADDFTNLASGGYAKVNWATSGSLEFTWDENTAVGEHESFANVGGISAPVWVRIIKNGTSVSAYYKTAENGTWTMVGTPKTPQSTAANSQIGLFVCGGGQVTTAAFEHFQGGTNISTTDDNLYFGGSGAGADANATLSGNQSVGSLDFTDYSGAFSFGSSTLSITAGNATFVAGQTVTAGSGALAFTAGSGTQTFTPKSGATYPALTHTAASTLQLATNDLTCLSFSNTAGALDFNGRNITTTSSGNFSISNGTTTTLTNLAGRTLTVAGTTSLNGQSGNLLNLNPGSAWTMASTGALTADYASIGNSNASVSGGTASNSTNSGSNSNWSFAGAVTTYYWNRSSALSSSTDFNAASNWSVNANGSGAWPASADDDDFTADALGSDWTFQDADNDAGTGSNSLTAAADQLTLQGRGLDIWGGTNQYVAVHRGDITGNFDVSLKIVSVSGGNNKSGLMMADDFTALGSGGMATISWIPAFSEIRFEVDETSTVGQVDVTENSASGLSLPVWIRLTKNGTTVKAYWKANVNNAWTQIGQAAGRVPQSTAANSRVGIFHAALSSSVTRSAVFDDFQGGTAMTATNLDLTFNGSGSNADANATLSAAFTAKSIDFTNYSGTFSFSDKTLTISGGAAFFSSTMGLTAGTGALSFDAAWGINSTFTPKSGATFPAILKSNANSVDMSTNALIAPSITLTGGSLNWGTGLTHQIGSLSTSSGDVMSFNNSTVQITSGNANLSGMPNMNANTGTLQFTGSSGTQVLTPRSGQTHPNITHSGASTLQLATNDLTALSFTNSGGPVDFNSRNLTATGNLSFTNGTPTTMVNLDGRTITVGGTASLAGSSGSLLNLNPFTAWTIASSGSLTASYATIMNSIASSTAGVPSNSTDGGSNTNWNFAASDFSAWTWSTRILLNTTASGAGVTGDVTNFPLLIRLNAENFIFSQAFSDGRDIRFQDPDGSGLSYHIDRWDATNKVAEVWVKVPRVDGNSDRDFITMFWGNGSASVASSASGTFGAYKGVFHLGESPGGSAPQFADASGTSNNGTAQGGATGDSVTAVIGKGFKLDGSSKYISSTTSYVDQDVATLGTWFRSVTGSGGKIIGWESAQTGLGGQYDRMVYMGNDGKLNFAIYNLANSVLTTASAYNDGQWHQVTARVDGVGMALYVDGGLVGSNSQTNPEATTGYWRAGFGGHGGWVNAPTSNYFNGSLDEVYFAHNSFSSDYIKLSYQTQRPNSRVAVLQNTGLSNWPYSTKVYINTTASGANIASNQSNYPLLVRLNNGNFPFSQASSTGIDLRFADSAGTLLPFEIERWDASSKLAEVWVLVPTVYGNNNSQWVKMYWGNSNAASLSSGSDVFLGSAGYAGVWHLAEDGSTTASAYRDASSAQNHGTGQNLTNASDVSGLVGIGSNFTRASLQAVSVAHNATLHPTGSFTVEGWLNSTSQGSYRRILNKAFTSAATPYDEYDLATDVNGNKTSFSVTLGGTAATVYSTTTLSNGAWYYSAGVWDGSNQRIYLNGAQEATSARTGTVNDYGMPFSIGRYGNDNSGHHDGLLDEVRVSTVARSADWLKLCYENMKATSTVVNVGGRSLEYAKSVQFNFNTTSTGANVSGNVSSIPILVRLSSSNFDFTAVRDDAADLRFIDKGGAGLYHEVVEWDKGNKAGKVWVKVPQVDGNSTTDYITAYYGCAACSGNPWALKDSVWSGYTSVYHLNAPETKAMDAAALGNHGNYVLSMPQVDGVVTKNAVFFDNTANSYVELPNESNYDFQTNVSISAWVKVTSWPHVWAPVVNHGDATWRIQRNNGNDNLCFLVTKSSTIYNANSTTNVNDGGWHHVVGTYDGANVRLYIDGVAGGTAPALTGNLDTDNNLVQIGTNVVQSARKWNGAISEVRLSNNSAVLSADFIKLSYENQKAASTLMSTPVTTASFRASKVYRFNTTASGANVSGDVYNFPLLIRITDAAITDSVQMSGKFPKDVRFLDGDGVTWLDYQVERWDPVNNAAEVWVKVPKVDGGSAGDFITLYYNDVTNGSVPDASCGSCVFETSNGFAGVWHLSENPNGDAASAMKDQTANLYHGTPGGAMTTADSVAGMAGGAIDFDGSNDLIYTANIGYGTGNVISNSAWFKTSAALQPGASNNGYIITKDKLTGTNPYAIYINGSNYASSAISNVSATASGTAMNDGAWHHLFSTYDGTTFRIYVDGSFKASSSPTPLTNSETTTIGGSEDTPTYRPFLGVIDEAVISKAVRDSNWIKLTYQTQRTDAAPLFNPSQADFVSSRKLVFNTTRTGANVMGDVSNFPLLVRLTGSALVDAVQNDWDDIRFLDSDGKTWLNYAVERWSKTLDSAEVWVMVPKVDGNSDRDFITLYYDDVSNGAVSNGQCASCVFSTGNNFQAVWHLNANVLTDETSNANSGTNTGSTDGDGVSGSGRNFDGTDDYISFGNGNSLKNISTAITVEAWIKTSMTGPATVVSAIRHDGHFTALQYGVGFTGAWSALWLPSLTYPPSDFGWNGVFTDNAWHHFAVQYQSGNYKVWKDGVVILTSTALTGNLATTATNPFVIGAAENGTEEWIGKMDEVRVSDAFRDSNYVKLSYQTQRRSGNLFWNSRPGPNNRTTLTAAPGTGAISLSWTTPVTDSSNADSVGIWVKYSGNLDSVGSTGQTKVALLSKTDSAYSYPATYPGNYVFGLAVRNSSGQWSPFTSTSTDTLQQVGSATLTDTIYVDSAIGVDGGTSAACTDARNPATPLVQVEDAVLCAQASGFLPTDTLVVRVMPGIYASNWDNDFDPPSTYPVVITSFDANSRAVLSSPERAGYTVELSSNSTLRRMDIRAATNGAAGIRCYTSADSVVIDGCRIYNNGAIRHDTGITIVAAGNEGTLITNSVIHEPTTYGVYVNSDDRTNIIGNVFYGTGAGTTKGIYMPLSAWGAGYLTITNNIFQNWGYGIHTTDADANVGVVSNNLFHLVTSASEVVGETDAAMIARDPLFYTTALASPNAFKVLPGSPAINAGTATISTGATQAWSRIAGYDMFGTARPQGTAPDIGLYEGTGYTPNPTGEFDTLTNTVSGNTVIVKNGKWKLVWDMARGGGINAFYDMTVDSTANLLAASSLLFDVKLDAFAASGATSNTIAPEFYERSRARSVIRQRLAVSASVELMVYYTVYASGHVYIQSEISNLSASAQANMAVGYSAKLGNASTVTKSGGALAGLSYKNGYGYLNTATRDVLLSVTQDLDGNGYFSETWAQAAGNAGSVDSVWFGTADLADIAQAMKRQHHFLLYLGDGSLDAGKAAALSADAYSPSVVNMSAGSLNHERSWQSQLTGHWTLDDGGGSTAKDKSLINANDAALTSATWTSGKVKGALRFSTASVGSVPDNNALEAGAYQTYMLWVKPDFSAMNSDAYVLSKGLGTSDGWHFRRVTGQPQIKFTMANVVLTSPALTTNTWNHLAAVVNGSRYVSLYVNGVLVASSTATATATANSNAMRMGENGGTNGVDRFAGDLDDVRIYATAASGADIQAIYRSGFSERYGHYYLRADNNNRVVALLNESAAATRIQPAFRIDNWYGTKTPKYVYLNGARLLPNVDFVTDSIAPDPAFGSLLIMQVNRVLTGADQTLFVDDNDSAGYLGTAGRMKSLTMSHVSGDKLVIKNFQDTVFGSATSGQWYTEFDLNAWTTPAGINTALGFGKMSTWKAAAIDPNLAISSANELAGLHSGGGQSVQQLKFDETSASNRMYDGGTGYAGPATLSHTVVDSSSTRMSFTLSPMTITGDGSLTLTKRVTVYPTGRMFTSYVISSITDAFNMDSPRLDFMGRYSGGTSGKAWSDAYALANARVARRGGTPDYHSLAAAVLSVKSATVTSSVPATMLQQASAAGSQDANNDNSMVQLHIRTTLTEGTDDPVTINSVLDISRDFTDSATADSLMLDVQTPATITALSAGTANPSDALDFNTTAADGFAEGDGAYVYTAGSGVAHFKLVNTVTHFNPAFRIKSWSFSTLPEFVIVDNQTLVKDYQYNAHVNFATSELIIQFNKTFAPGTHLFYISHKTGLAVTLDSFEAVSGEGVDSLHWSTQSEFENLGFNVWRRISPVQALPEVLADGGEKAAGAGIANALLDAARQEAVAQAAAAAAAKTAAPGADAADTLPQSRYTEAELKALGYVRLNAKIIPGAKGGSSATTQNYGFVDRTAAYETTYEYLLESVDFAGVKVQYGPRKARPRNPLETALESNYPNPFNPVTTLRFSLKEKAKVSLVVYDAKGRLVRVLVRPDKHMQAGKYRLIWDARDDKGFEVPSGQYFYRFTAPKYHKTRKMILVK